MKGIKVQGILHRKKRLFNGRVAEWTQINSNVRAWSVSCGGEGGDIFMERIYFSRRAHSESTVSSGGCSRDENTAVTS